MDTTSASKRQTLIGFVCALVGLALMLTAPAPAGFSPVIDQCWGSAIAWTNNCEFCSDVQANAAAWHDNNCDSNGCQFEYSYSMTCDEGNSSGSRNGKLACGADDINVTQECPGEIITALSIIIKCSTCLPTNPWQ